MASLEKGVSLPPAYKKAVEVAAQAMWASMLAHYDTKNPDAMLRLVATGVQISLFPPDVIEAILAAGQEHDAGLIAIEGDSHRETVEVAA